MTRLPSYLLLGWALMSVSSCTTEDQEILVEVSALAWADASPEVGATVVLEEQRLSNGVLNGFYTCLLYTSPSPRDRQKSRMPSSA